MYRSLGVQQRAQFLQAAAKWQEAIIHWQDRPSLSFTLMVIACEALKPADADDRQNCYDVIEALLGRTAVDRIRQNPFPAQRVRSTHLHTGEFHGSELVLTDFLASYRDPTFRQAHREMFRVTSAAIIEWLKRRGTLQMSVRKDRTDAAELTITDKDGATFSRRVDVVEKARPFEVAILREGGYLRWPRLFEQKIRVTKWIVGRG